MDGCYVGIDLGGTYIKAIAIAGTGGAVNRVHLPTPTAGAGAVMARLAEAGRQAAGGHAIRAVGVAVPGVVDMHRGIVHFIPNLPGAWADRPVARELGEALGAPVALLNDARAATYGELQFGAGRGCRHFAMIAVGTGIGGGLVLNGELYLGSAGRAGEVGHQVIDLHGPRCGCGANGCAESLASGPALAAAAMRLVVQGLDTRLRDLCQGDAGRITPRLVAEAAADGDPLAQELIDQEAARLGALAANLAVVLNPERIIIGGGVALAGEPLLAGVRRTLAARLSWLQPHGPVEVVAAALGDEAGALGAAAWGRKHAQGGERE